MLCMCGGQVYLCKVPYTLHGSRNGTQVSRLESMSITIPHMLSHLTDLIVQ